MVRTVLEQSQILLHPEQTQWGSSQYGFTDGECSPQKKRVSPSIHFKILIRHVPQDRSNVISKPSICVKSAFFLLIEANWHMYTCTSVN